MSHSKANLILAAAAVVLAVPTMLTIRGESAMFTAMASVPHLFDGFTADNVKTLVIAQPKANQPAVPAPPPNPSDPAAAKKVERDVLQFVRADKKWVVGQGELQNAAVQTQRIDNDLIKHLQEIRTDKQTVVVADASDEVLAKYDLTEDKAMIVQAFNAQGQPVAELLIGKEPDQKQGTETVHGVFVRKTGSRDVVLYEMPQFWRRSVKLEEWLDKKVHQIETGKIVKFAFKNPASDGAEVVFEKKDGSATWIATQAPVDVGAPRQTEIEGMVQRFGIVNAQDVRLPLPRANLGECGLKPPLYEIAATVKDGDTERTYTILAGKKLDDKNEVYMTSSESQFLMTMPMYLLSPYERNPKDLFDPKTGGDKQPDPEAKKDAPKDGK